MHNWDQLVDFDTNIRNIRHKIQHDYTLSDKDASELLLALDKVEPDHICTYTSVKIVGCNTTFTINTGAGEGAVTESIFISAKPDSTYFVPAIGTLLCVGAMCGICYTRTINRLYSCIASCLRLCF